jgi:phosphate transport system substrate-binding protein
MKSLVRALQISGIKMKNSSKAILAIAAISAISVPASAQMRRNIRIVGSSTVYPFTKAVAERFARSNPGVPAPIVESTGTGAGMKLFCAGVGAQHPDIENASRRIKLSEFKTCAANGVSQITEIQVGLDGLSLATAKATTLNNISVRDLYMAIAKAPFGKPNTAKTWKDVNASLPALPIRVYGPPTTSGTRSSLEDLLMEPNCASIPQFAALKKTDEAKYNSICKGIRDDGAYINAGENDNLIVQKLEANPGTVGLFGYSYLEENASRLKGISLNGVAPSYATISSFKYPGARGLFIYVKNAHTNAIPGIRQFIAEYVKESTWGPKGYLTQYGLIASPDAVRGRSLRMGMSLTAMNTAGLK